MKAVMASPTLRNENALLLGQKRVLEMVATGAPLADTLAELTLLIEAQEPGLRCGILVVTDDGACFRRGSGPSLPEVYHSALDGAPITPPYLGPCGEAAHRGAPVVVPDIANDARWADTWRDLVTSCGLAACRSTPVHASDGRVLASFAMYYDHPRDPHPAHPQLIEIATHLAGIALERKRTEETVTRNERWLRGLVEALPAAVYTTNAAGRITRYNQAAVDLWGCRPELGRAAWCGSWRLYRPDGAPLPHDQCPMAVALKENRPIRGAEATAERPDGTRTPFLAYPTPVHDASGTLVGAVNMLVDISDRKRAEESQNLLMAELDHRVKNILATVQSIASATLQADESAQTYAGRLAALAHAHSLLARGRWNGAGLEGIVKAELAPYADGPDAERVTISGSEVHLRPRAAQTLSMAIHELTTNAAKYGA